MPPAERNSVKTSLVTLRILHLAMCASLGIYLIMLFMVISGQQQKGVDQVAPAAEEVKKAEPPGDMITIVLAAMAATSAVGLLVVRSKLMPRGADGGGRAEALAGEPVPDALSGPQKKALARLFTASIVAWALAESVAIYGLVLGFLHMDVMRYLPFAACALVLLLVMTPRRAQVEGVVRAARA